MQEDIFYGLMHAYHKNKISVIPLKEDRTPMIKEWSKFNHELPEEPLFIKGQKGIGLLAGPESGVMIVDFDTKDEALLNELRALFPTSPIQRFGSKGMGVIYGYNPDIYSRKFTAIKVEIFADSGYVCIPPSYHDKAPGKKYVWIGEELLNFPKKNLPTFGLDVMEKLEELNRKYEIDRVVGSVSDGSYLNEGGRHNILARQGFAGLNTKDIETVAKELVEYDYKNHKPSWFEEDLRARNKEHALKLAIKFVTGLKKTKDKRIEMENKLAEEIIAKQKMEAHVIKPYPRPEGIMSHIADLIEEISYTNVPNMALGSALAIFSVVIGNRYSFDRTMGNVFCLLLAESGTGKKFGIEIAKKLLVHHNMIGSANYMSSTAIMSSLKDFIVRLDISDEFSKVLGLINSNGPWQKSIPQNLCDIWSSSHGEVTNDLTKQSQNEKKAENKQVDVVFLKPFISILSATTISEFKRTTNHASFNSGLIPRFLSFIDTPSLKCKTRLNFNKIDNQVKEISQFITMWKNSHSEVDFKGFPVEKELKLAEDVEEYFDSKMTEFHVAQFYTVNPIEKLMLSRKKEFYKKLSLLHALSRGEQNFICKQDLVWAESFYDVGYHNQIPIFRECASENEIDSQKEMILAIIRELPNITKRELTRKTKKILQPMRDKLIQDLLDGGQIAKVENVSGNNKTLTRFVALLDS